MRAGVRSDLRANLVLERVGERHACGAAARRARCARRVPRRSHVLPDHEALDDLGQLLHLPIDLRRADPHAAGIERRVAAAVDDHAAVRRELGPVAMSPGVRVIGRSTRRDTSRRRGRSRTRRACSGNGAVHTSSPCSPTTERPVIVEDFDLHPEPRVCSSPRHTGPIGLPQREARDDVRAAADAAQPHVALHVLRRRSRSCLGQRAPRRENRLQRSTDRASRSAGVLPSRRARATSRSCRTRSRARPRPCPTESAGGE